MLECKISSVGINSIGYDSVTFGIDASEVGRAPRAVIQVGLCQSVRLYGQTVPIHFLLCTATDQIYAAFSHGDVVGLPSSWHRETRLENR